MSFASRNIAPLGYAAFAFALGTLLSLLFRRTVPAMALTLAVFIALQILFAAVLRPNLLPSTHRLLGDVCVPLDPALRSGGAHVAEFFQDGVDLSAERFHLLGQHREGGHTHLVAFQREVLCGGGRLGTVDVEGRFPLVDRPGAFGKDGGPVARSAFTVELTVTSGGHRRPLCVHDELRDGLRNLLEPGV
jgi:hypothetical protein